MHETNRWRQTFLEAISERARHLTPLRGRLLLALKCRLNDCSSYGPERGAKKRVESGIFLASVGLWEDASYQWQRAVQLDPLNSDARNNLAVAYELVGKSALAKSEYERALALERNNIYIRQNYELHRRALTPERTLERHELATRTNLCH